MLLDRFAQLLIFFASHLSGCRHPDEERPTLGIFITSQIFFYFNNMRAEIFMMHGYSCKCDYDLLLVGAGPKKPLFCVPTDELLRTKDDLLSEGGQSLSSLTEQD